MDHDNRAHATAQYDGHISRQSSDSMDSDVEMSRLHDPISHSGHNSQMSRDITGDSSFTVPTAQSDGVVEERSFDCFGMNIKFQLTPGYVHWLLINIGLILLWYTFSVSISVYNKWMFGDGQLSFKFPLFTTSLHMAVQFVLAFLTMVNIPSLRPGANVPNHDKEQWEETPHESPSMSFHLYAFRIAPCAAATAMDIGAGNTSLRMVSLVFFTMVKSSTLGFVLLFAFLFRLEKPSFKLVGIIGLMTVGVIMMVFGETAFSALGFVLLIMASMFSGLRWSLTQILLKRHPATSNPISSLFFLTPVMFFILLILAVCVEGIVPLRLGLSQLAEQKGGWFTAFLLVFPGVLAFLMTTAEFALIQRTSVVTLSVAGIIKEVITIGAGGVVFDERLTPINSVGLAITIVAIIGYNVVRFKSMNPSKRRASQQEDPEENAPMLSTDPTHEEATGLEARRDRAPSTADLIRRSLSVSTSRPPTVPSAPHRATPSPSKKQNIP